jgi:hypothetical protein
MVVHEQVTDPEGMDSINCSILSKAVGDLTLGSILRFRLAAWDREPDGMPQDISAAWHHLLLPGGVMDGSNVLSLLAAEIEPHSAIEFRCSGPDAQSTLDRIEAAISVINARMLS